MKRFVFVVVVLVAAAAVGVPYWLGVRAERGYQEILAAQDREAQWSVASVRYRRGWLRSEAEARLTWTPWPAGAAGEQGADLSRWTRLVVKSRISHGPWPLTGAFAEQPRPGSAAAVVDSEFFLAEAPPGTGEALEGVPLLQVRTRVGWGGTVRSRVHAPAVTIPVGSEGARLTWGGAKGTITWGGPRAASGALAGPGFAFWKGGEGVEVADVSVRFDLRETETGLLVGDYDGSAGRFTASDAAAGSPISVEGFRLAGSSLPAGPYLHGTASLELARAQAGDTAWGPAALRLTVRNLDAPVIAGLQKTLRDLQQENVPPEEAARRTGEILREAVPKLLARSPELSLEELRAATSDGEVSARGEVSFDGSVPVDLDEPRALLAGVRARLAVSAPARLVRVAAAGQARNQLAAQEIRAGRKPDPAEVEEAADATARRQLKTLVDRGLLRTEGATYAVEVAFDRGRLQVNGAPWSAGR